MFNLWEMVLLLLAVTTMTAGCGGGGGQSPSSARSSASAPALSVLIQARPSVVSAGDIIDGEVKQYKLAADGRSWQLIATMQNDGSGSFLLSSFAGEPMLLEFSGGCYVDKSFDQNGSGRTGISVCMSSGDVLRAVINVDANTSDVAITPFTELAASLANASIQQGQSPFNAIQISNTNVGQWLGVDILATQIQNLSDLHDLPDAEALYSFELLGLGTWVRQKERDFAGTTLGHAPYNVISLITAISGFVNDHGSLQGTVASFGNWVVTADDLRHAVAANAMRSVRWQYDSNNSAISRGATGDLFIPYFVATNDYSGGLFSTPSPTTLDEGGPAFIDDSIHSSGSGSLDYPLSIRYEDIVGIPQGGIEVLVDDIQYDKPVVPGLSLPGTKTILINTTLFKNGLHKVTIKLKNNLGHQVSDSATVNFQNDCALWPRACT